MTTTSYISDVILRGPTTSVVFDTALTVTTGAASQVTSHPVESGSFISDHIVNEDITISIRGIISAIAHKIAMGNNSQYVSSQELKYKSGTFTANLISADALSPAEARARIFEMRDRKELLTITTPTALYNNVVITRITEPRDSSHGGALGSDIASWEVVLDLKQVRVVGSGTSQVPVATTKSDKADAVDGSASSESVPLSSGSNILNVLTGG